MIGDIDKYVDFLSTNNLSPTQFLYLYLCYTQDKKNIDKLEIDRFDINYLVDNGWLSEVWEGGLIVYDLHKSTVRKKFIDKFAIDEEDAYQQLCDVYPKWIVVKNIPYPTIKGDPAKIAEIYRKYHKNNKHLHEEAVEITKKYYNNHPVTGNIEDYILNRRWLLLKDMINEFKKDAFSIL